MLARICRNVLVGCGLTLAAFAQQSPANSPLKTLHCTSGPVCSYVVSEPSGVDPSNAYPALFMLDPLARGEVAAEVARKAADAQGVIVFASNDSHNGPMQEGYAAAVAMWNDAHRRYRLDPQRTYLAGFSGGARLATAFARSCGNCIATVIANGAGLASNLKPDEVAFDTFLTVGDMDFNYPEVVQLRMSLAKLHKPVRLFVFHGPHRWSPEEGWQQAFDWIALRAMKGGPRANNAQIEAIRQRFADYADRSLTEFGVADAWRARESNVRDLSDDALTPTSAEQAALKREQKEFDQYYDQQVAMGRELNRIADPAAAVHSLSSSEPGADASADPYERRQDALRTLRSRLATLRKRVDKGQTPSIWDRRNLASLLAGCIETADPLLDAGQVEQALDLYTVLVDFAPSPAGGHLGRARAYAKMNKSKDAFAEAQAAVSAGLPAEALRRAPELAEWLKKPEWQALLTK